MRKILLVSAVVAASGAVHAADMAQWGEAGDWAILVDAESGNGCLARKQFDNDLTIEIGAAPDRAGGFFAAYNPAWTNIEEGKTALVSFDFEDAAFEGDAVGVIRDGLPGAYAFFDNPEFVTEFGKRLGVVVSGEDGTEIDIDLSGTTKAIEAVQTCQSEQPKATTE